MFLSHPKRVELKKEDTGLAARATSPGPHLPRLCGHQVLLRLAVLQGGRGRSGGGLQQVVLGIGEDVAGPVDAGERRTRKEHAPQQKEARS